MWAYTKARTPSQTRLAGQSAIRDAALPRVFGAGIAGARGASARWQAAPQNAVVLRDVRLLPPAGRENGVCLGIEGIGLWFGNAWLGPMQV